MKIIITSVLLILLQVGYAQDNSKTKNIGTFCYIDSLSSKLVFNEECTVIQKDKFINVAVKSKYQFSVLEKQKAEIYKMLAVYSDYSVETSRKKLGNIAAIYCVGLTKTVNKDKTGFELISGTDRIVDVYYHKGYLVLIFPKISNETVTSPAHRVYIPADCVQDFINVFKV
jgi:hypothetical protein